MLVGVLVPSLASAGILTDFLADILGDVKEKTSSFAESAEGASRDVSIQTLSLLQPAMNSNPTAGRGGGDITIVDSSAVVSMEGPSGTIADIERAKNATISIYVVRQGDTLSEIAELFGVSVNTIAWANNMSRSSTLKVGQTLTILPVTGIKYTIKKGDTLSSIAKKFDGDAAEIVSYNGLGDTLVVGTMIIIPNGEVAVPVASTPSSRIEARGPSVSYDGYYIRPITGGVRSQGIHGYNGVDLAVTAGTLIVASASGDVIISREGGWNGGYGNYVVIRHANGTQTLYAHNSRNAVGIGEPVVQGQLIAYVGATGRATGPHIHFEIRGGPRNPF